MSLDRGALAKDIKKIWWQNYQRLLIWSNVGADVKNGLWAMYGTRLGCYMTNCTDWDYVNVRDFDYLTEFWKNKIEPNISEDSLLEEIANLGTELQDNLNLEMAVLDPDASRFFKRVYQNTPRIIGR
jgi:hypothetical protein